MCVSTTNAAVNLQLYGSHNTVRFSQFAVILIGVVSICYVFSEVRRTMQVLTCCSVRELGHTPGATLNGLVVSDGNTRASATS